MSSFATPIEEFFNQNRADITNRLGEFLKIPSISTFPAYEQQCVDAARWLASQFEELGLEYELLDTGSKPLVFARTRDTIESAPTVLFYGHYDVQPVADDWSSDPFVLTEKGDRFYARGAQDNKGQVMYVLTALRAMKEAGFQLPNLKFLIEGEEESGSKGINAILPAISELIKADYLLVCDTSSPELGIGSLTMSLRGALKMKATFSGPSTELHSGHHGGLAMNPALVHAHVMGQLIGKGPDGNFEVMVPNFYDGAILPPHDLIRKASQFDPTDAEYAAMIGIEPSFGDPKISHTERTGLMPALDIHRTHGGWGEEGLAGFKTAIPASIESLLSVRYVHGQDPENLFRSIEVFLRSHLPPGVNFQLENLGVGKPLAITPGSSGLDEAITALEVAGRNNRAAISFGGGSIPVLSTLAEISGASPILIGFGLAEDNIHGTDESFSWEQFQRGIVAVSEFLRTVPK